uniref:DUF4806 domain-containing protein n=1 Tax=Paramormyrops kingsleyae TaxID=1676925 RepID=A0A3B3SS43_9TELE
MLMSCVDSLKQEECQAWFPGGSGALIHGLRRGLFPPPPKKNLPPAPFINFPVATTAASFLPVPNVTIVTATPHPNLSSAPITTLPAAAPPASHRSLTNMLETWEAGDDIPSLASYQTFSWAPEQSSEPALLREVLTKLEMVLDQQKTIIGLLQQRESKLLDLSIEECLLPLQDLPQLLSLEQRMQQDPELQLKMVNFLGLFGGADVRDCTWRILKKVFFNTLAKKLNWRGVNGKTSLASLKLREVVIAAVRRNPLTASAAEVDIEATIIWAKANY